MGARAWHVARAERNKEAADFLAEAFEEWSMTALFYSALHYVHSTLADEASIPKDERHPRKHTQVGGADGRGVNQLVRDLYPEIHPQYRSLFELSYRTRYDVAQLGPMAAMMAEKQWRDVRDFCLGKNQGRQALKARDV
ncbi:hypothetical protein [Phycicoccus sp. 3266]|uniref:hypothetical protein n=1 Tax=Phycicoccus sp. 3266 TaxID=2817751 RepID=UPI00285D5C50|nr:hypothetical protein [Phycicoccus sp. 3266]MDR6861992.1 hypothetical protein [Phycicoccus sp. 3266]